MYALKNLGVKSKEGVVAVGVKFFRILAEISLEAGNDRCFYTFKFSRGEGVFTPAISGGESNQLFEGGFFLHCLPPVHTYGALNSIASP